jgi:hypothetical protein
VFDTEQRDAKEVIYSIHITLYGFPCAGPPGSLGAASINVPEVLQSLTRLVFLISYSHTILPIFVPLDVRQE